MSDSNVPRLIPKPNESTNTQFISGTPFNEPVPIKASVEIEDGSLLASDGVGKYTKATPSSKIIPYILSGSIKATDKDFDSIFKERNVVIVPNNEVYKLLMPVGNGTATAAMIGNKYNLYNEKSLDVSSTGRQFFITDFINSSLVKGFIPFIAATIPPPPPPPSP